MPDLLTLGNAPDVRVSHSGNADLQILGIVDPDGIGRAWRSTQRDRAHQLCPQGHHQKHTSMVFTRFDPIREVCHHVIQQDAMHADPDSVLDSDSTSGRLESRESAVDVHTFNGMICCQRRAAGGEQNILPVPDPITWIQDTAAADVAVLTEMDIAGPVRGLGSRKQSIRLWSDADTDYPNGLLGICESVDSSGRADFDRHGIRRR